MRGFITKVKNWFVHSETILWGRLQIVFGALWGVLLTTDLSTILSPKWLTVWLIFSGAVTEVARRRNTVTTVTDRMDGVNVVTLQPAPSPPSDPPAGVNG
jgi:hypothetical protein